MKTTLIIPDPLFRKLKKRAIDRGETLSSLVTEFIHRGLTEEPQPVELPPLPTYDLGKMLVDVANREELYRVVDTERDERLYGLRSED